MRDVTYAVRSLARTPAFTVATILTLAIGIGAATAIYSVVDTILLKPLPYPGGDRLVQLIEHFPTNVPTRPIMQKGITHQEYLDWRTRSKTLEDAVAVIPMAQRSVRTPNGAVGLWGLAASANAFELLQVDAMLGRAFTRNDDVTRDVAVLSHETWRRHFLSDPAIVGKTIELRTGGLMAPIPPRILTVVGVMPPDFAFPTGTYDFYAPLALNPSARPPQVTTLARLAPGVSLQAAIDEANLIGGSIRPPWPTTGPQLSGPRFEVQSVKATAVASMAPALRILLAAVVVVLLIVCANVANLLFARGTARQREVAVRLAVGASRARILRQILTECGVLALAGGALGALVGAAGVTLVKRLTTVDAPGIYRFTLGPSVLPRANEVGVDWQLFAVAFAIAAITAIAFGMLPALQLSRTSQMQAMGSRASSAGRRESRIRAGLTLAQLALATLMLSGAGLLIHSFVKLSTFDKGYSPANVLSFNLLFPDQYSTARKGETIETLLARFRANPNVRAVGFARHGLLIGEELYIGAFIPPGKTLEELKTKGIRTRSVSDGFLTAMAVPVLEGREFLPSDDGSAPGAVVINRLAARHYFGDASPVGQVMEWHMGKTRSSMTVVGVVENVRQESATDPLVPEVFVDYRQYLAFHEVDEPQRQNQTAIGFLSFALRTAGDPSALVPVVRGTLNSVDPNIGIDAIVPLEQLEAGARARERFYAVVLGMFAAVAALLAAIGVYGVLAYAVVQRTKEIGVRMALGARRPQVLGLIMRKGLMLTMLGVTLGLAAAAAGARYLESMLFEVKPLDAWTFAIVAVSFTVVATLASYLPARRATRVDPVVALRVD